MKLRTAHSGFYSIMFRTLWIIFNDLLLPDMSSTLILKLFAPHSLLVKPRLTCFSHLMVLARGTNPLCPILQSNVDCASPHFARSFVYLTSDRTFEMSRGRQYSVLSCSRISLCLRLSLWEKNVWKVHGVFTCVETDDTSLIYICDFVFIVEIIRLHDAFVFRVVCILIASLLSLISVCSATPLLHQYCMFASLY